MQKEYTSEEVHGNDEETLRKAGKVIRWMDTAKKRDMRIKSPGT